MSAHEQQREAVVLVRVGHRGVDDRDLELARGARLLTAPLIDQPGRRQEPGPGVRGKAITRPVVGRRDQCLLDGVLGRVEITRSPGERAEDLRRQVAKQVLDVDWEIQRAQPPTVCRKASISLAFEGALSMIRRTMIGCWMALPPGPGAAEILPAISRARASDSTSTIS